MMKPSREFVDPHINSQLIFSSEAMVIQWQKVSLFNRCAETTEHSYRKKKMNLDLCLKLVFRKKTQKRIVDLNIKVKNKV